MSMDRATTTLLKLPGIFSSERSLWTGYEFWQFGLIHSSLPEKVASELRITAFGWFATMDWSLSTMSQGPTPFQVGAGIALLLLIRRFAFRASQYPHQ
jgi:hypothetical protein